MSATAFPPTFTDFRDAVVDLVESGEPLQGVEDVIDHSDLGEDLEAALWLVAYFSESAPAPPG